MAYKPMEQIVAFRTSRKDFRLWKAHANREGLKLSSWMRSVMNQRVAESVGGSVRCERCGLLESSSIHDPSEKVNPRGTGGHPMKPGEAEKRAVRMLTECYDARGN